MTEEQWIALLIAGMTMLAPTIAIIVGSRIANTNAKRAAASAAAAVVATKQVAETLAATTDSTNEKLNTIHVLVNSRLTEALKKIDALELRLQAATGEPPTGEPARGDSGS